MFTLVMLLASLAVITTFERPSQDKKTRNKNTPEAILQAERDQKIKRRAEGYAKKDQPDKFIQLHREIRTREGDLEPRYKPNYRIDAMKKAGIMDMSGRVSSKTRLGKSTLTATWTERGPANFSGRARGLVVDPADVTGHTWFVGSVGGGIWKTTDAGLTYTDKTPNLPNLATTVLVMAESNHDVIYAGTGEGFHASVGMIQGDGIFKSTDHGDSWTQLSSTAANEDFFYVNRLVVDPANEDILVVGTNNGIFKSSNGGTSWANVYDSPDNEVQHVIANPASFDTLFATVNGLGVIKSVNAGNTWTMSSSGLGGGARYEIAMAPTNRGKLYVAIQNGSASDLYMSSNGGANWLPVRDTSATQPTWLGAQGWYDNTIAVHPDDENTVFVGGINIWKISMLEGSTTTTQLTADTVGTKSFYAGVNFGGAMLGGSAAKGVDFLGATSVTDADYVSVEVRFGPGKAQKAHRFTGASTTTLNYANYIYVPFEVWDVTNNQQIMFSFWDHNADGAFDLRLYNASALAREYMFINAVPYDSTAQNTTIAVDNGYQFKNIYAMWPVLAVGATWSPNNLPASKIIFTYSSVTALKRRTVQTTNWYPGLTRPSGGTYPWIHADQHNIVMIPKGAGNFDILVSNDGGTAHSTDGGVTWIFNESTPDGMNSTQFYGVDKKPGALAFIGGTQDNGTWRSPVNATDTSRWIEQIGGDGFDAVWKGNDGNQLIGSLYDNRFYKSTDGGATWNSATNGLLDVDNANSYFASQLGRSKVDPDLIFAIGRSGVWRSDNFGDSWTLAPLSAANFGFSTAINFVEISQADPQVVWAGKRMSASGKVNVSTDGGLTFNPTVNYTTATLGVFSGIATHPTDPNTAYVLFSFVGAPKILRTTDLGQTWEDISGFNANSTSNNGFPDVATYCLQVNPNNTNELWAGTEIGLFISTDNGANWAYANDGLPAASIWEMKVIDDQIVVATHGRGIWTAQITTPVLPTVTLSPRLDKAAQSPATGNVVVQASLRSSYDSTFVKVNDANAVTLGSTTVKDTAIALSALTPGNVTIQVVSYKSGKAYKSTSSTISVVQASAPRTHYSNNFNSASSDFSGTLFNDTTLAGFANGALHTPHPYADNTNNTFQLNIPITVTPDSCILAFDEIALVEKGETGTVFGDPEFWDYAIVEGTSDGINWVYLADGWDARLYSQWLTAYDAGTTPTSAMFKKHVINIRNTFSSGTTIFIRFRLFADAASTGWGWAVDNVGINPDRVPPTLTLGALASPVVNVVRFAIGANEKLSFASLLINSNPVTMTKQGNLYFGNYTITGPGSLAALANGTDSSNNFATALNRNYTVSLLTKSAVFENYTLSGSGNGYWVLGKSVTGDIPSKWHSLGASIDVAATGSASDFKAEFNYDEIDAVRSQYADFDESKIGIYERVNGEWKYAGGEGKNGKVSTAFKGNQLAVFYNPDHTFVPTEFALSQNYPNPFNPSTTIQYDLPKEAKVVLKVYNMLGQEVRTLVNATKGQGRYQAKWDGKNRFGNTVASGVYLYRLEAGTVVKSKKMLFIK